MSGFRIFSLGDLGRAHVRAHRALDEGRLEEGYRELRAVLETASGSGSQWVHVQWHMVVFEIAVGRWHEAHRRFVREVLPAATNTNHALTDAPAGLWRLALSPDRPAHVELPWTAVARRAASRMAEGTKPFVELHHLLAFAGAGDVRALDAWIAKRAGRRSPLTSLARGLRCFAAADYARAAMWLGAAMPHLEQIGGSRAQRQLFEQLQEEAWRRNGAAPAQQDTPPPSSRAA